MELTENLLETIYKRAMQYCVAKYGSEADEIELEDGYLQVNFVSYCCGDRDVESHTINAECLTQDLDKVYDERMKEEAEARVKREAERKRQEKIRKERELRQRKAKYEELKKEFEK